MNVIASLFSSWSYNEIVTKDMKSKEIDGTTRREDDGDFMSDDEGGTESDDDEEEDDGSDGSGSASCSENEYETDQD